MNGVDIGAIVAAVTALVTAITSLVKLFQHQKASAAIHAQLSGVESQVKPEPPAAT